MRCNGLGAVIHSMTEMQENDKYVQLCLRLLALFSDNEAFYQQVSKLVADFLERIKTQSVSANETATLKTVQLLFPLYQNWQEFDKPGFL